MQGKSKIVGSFPSTGPPSIFLMIFYDDPLQPHLFGRNIEGNLQILGSFPSGLGKPKLHAKFEVASFSHYRNIKRKPWILGSSPSLQSRPLFLRGVLLHVDLYWLDVADSSPSQSTAKYLTDCCVAVSDIAGRQRLRSTHRRQLDVRLCPTVSTFDSWSAAILHCWTNCLELASWWTQRWACRYVSEVIENTVFWTILVCSVH